MGSRLRVLCCAAGALALLAFGVASATTYTPAPVDDELIMQIDGELRLDKNAIWAELTCPSSEVSPPCQGKSWCGTLP